MLSRLVICVHPNPGESAPKIWGGGEDKNKGTDFLFFGGVDKGLNLQRKSYGYIANKLSEKCNKGYTKILLLGEIEDGDAETIVEQVRDAIAAAGQGEPFDASKIPDEFRSEVVKALGFTMNFAYPGMGVVFQLVGGVIQDMPNKVSKRIVDAVKKAVETVSKPKKAEAAVDLSW